MFAKQQSRVSLIDLATVVVLLLAILIVSLPGGALYNPVHRWLVQRHMTAAIQKEWSALVQMSQPLYSEPGPPVVVEFTDYQCPFCRAASPMVDSAVSDGVRLAVLQFPLSIHPRARVAALAALCGARSGRFAKIHRYLMNHIEWMASDDSSIVPAIEPIDSAAFVACQGSEQTRKSLAQEIAVANTLGIAGTPMFVTAGGVLKQPVTAASLRALADDGSK